MGDYRILRKVYFRKSGYEHVSGANIKEASSCSNAMIFEKAKFRQYEFLHDVVPTDKNPSDVGFQNQFLATKPSTMQNGVL